MLKKILSISGKPGLYKLISQGKNMLVVESLSNGKRMPSYSSDKAISLGDIAIFTDGGEVPLAQVFENIKTKENGGEAAIDPKSNNDELRAYLAEVLPNYDKERVYPSDIKKMLNWYNLLIANNITDFLVEEKESAGEQQNEQLAEEKP
jgi:hypothetical protein